MAKRKDLTVSIAERFLAGDRIGVTMAIVDTMIATEEKRPEADIDAKQSLYDIRGDLRRLAAKETSN